MRLNKIILMKIKAMMKYLFYPFAILCLTLTCKEFFPVLIYAFKHVMIYQWMLYGMAAYFIIRKIGFISRNERWLQTTSHEVTHALVGMLFFHKIHSLQANEDNGVVYHSGRKFGNVFISLAPYCLPVFTYVFLLMRIIGANKMLYVFDILIGLSLAFHLVCFCSQTRISQPDIQGQGYIKAFLFLFVSWFFNATIILLSIRKGILGSFAYIFPKYWDDIIHWWNFIL